MYTRYIISAIIGFATTAIGYYVYSNDKKELSKNNEESADTYEINKIKISDDKLE